MIEQPSGTSMAWVGDRLVPRAQATVPLDDFAARYGAACFETMLARNGRVFRLSAHLDRLAFGLRGMGVEPPPSEAIVTAIDATLAANGLRDASLRLVVSAGSGHAPYLESASAPLMTLTADALRPPPAAPRLRVVSVRLDEHRPLLGAKTANFLPYLLARREARLAGADDALLLNHAGDVAEAGAANLFAVLDDVLVTPVLESGPIAGITRVAVIEVAHAVGVRVVERRIAPGELQHAQAVVITNSIAGVLPVASIEGSPPASPTVLDWRSPAEEPATLARLREAYVALVEHECAVAGPHGEA